eukprot:PhM_4_TR17427/c1_g2_i1/m.87422
MQVFLGLLHSFASVIQSCDVFPCDVAAEYPRNVQADVLLDVLDQSDVEDDDEAIVEELFGEAEGSRIGSIAQHVHYNFCPWRSDMSLYEFFSSVVDVKKGQVDENDGNSRVGGRQPNLRRCFVGEHPQKFSHYVQRRSKHCVPVFSGFVPSHPGKKPTSSAQLVAWHERCRKWATFCVLVFLPWSTSDAAMAERLRNPFEFLQSWSSDIVHGRNRSVIDLCRHTAMWNCTTASSQDVVERKLCSTFRYRNADKWVNDGHCLENGEVLAVAEEIVNTLNSLASSPARVPQHILRLSARMDELVPPLPVVPKVTSTILCCPESSVLSEIAQLRAKKPEQQHHHRLMALSFDERML